MVWPGFDHQAVVMTGDGHIWIIGDACENNELMFYRTDPRYPPDGTRWSLVDYTSVPRQEDFACVPKAENLWQDCKWALGKTFHYGLKYHSLVVVGGWQLVVLGGGRLDVHVSLNKKATYWKQMTQKAEFGVRYHQQGWAFSDHSIYVYGGVSSSRKRF